MTPPEEFLESFHNVQGKTLGNRQAYFRKYLEVFKDSNPDPGQLDFIAKSIIPRTKLEDTLKLDFLIDFRMFPALLEVLKGEKVYLIKKVLKQKWLFQEPFEAITPDHLVDDLLANVSYVTRKTILRRLSALLKDQSLADAYFDRVAEKYGEYEALPLMYCCSHGKVLKLVKTYHLNLNQKQLLKLLKVNPDFLMRYLEIIEETFYPNDFSKCLRYLAGHHIDVYLELEKKYDELQEPLNRKGTKAVLQKKREAILAKPGNYVSYLDMPYVQRSFKKQFNEFFRNFFPKDPSRFSVNLKRNVQRNALVSDWRHQSAISCCLLPLREEKKLRILCETFNQLYGLNLFDYPEKFTDLRVLPVNAIEKYVEDQVKKGRDEDNLMWYLPVGKSIPWYKNKINITSSISHRGILLQYLINTCNFNGKDTISLLEVLKYFLVRHRNDDVSNRSKFLDVLSNSFNLADLSSEHWEKILEILNIFESNGERYGSLSKFENQYLQYRLTNHLPIREEILKLLVRMKNGSYHFNLFQNNPSHEKACLLEFHANLEDVLREQPKDLQWAQISFFKSLYNWNCRHPNDAFDLFGEYATYFGLVKQQWISDSKGIHSKFFESLIVKQDWNNLEKFDWNDIFWKYMQSNSLNYLYLNKILKDEPDCIVRKLDLLLNLPEKRLRAFWKICSKLEEISKNAVKMCKIEVNSEGIRSMPSVKIKLLSLFLETNEYIKEISTFIPTDLKIEKSLHKDYLKTQSAAVKHLKYTNQLSAALDTLLRFSRGDYLCYALDNIYYMAFHLPEKNVQLFLNELMTRAVSVRKHTVYITTQISSMENIKMFLTSWGLREKNPSIKKFIIKCSMKHFVRNPSESTWQLLVSNAHIMQEDDEEAFDYFLDYNSIPEDYRPRFIELSWDIFDNAKEKIRDKKFRLISNLSRSVVSSLKPEFCFDIIKLKLFSGPDCNTSYLDFTCMYVTARPEDAIISERLDQVFELIRKVITKFLHDAGSTVRCTISKVVEKFCAESFKLNSKVLVTLFYSKLQSLLPLEDLYRDLLITEFIKCFFEIGDEAHKWKKFAALILHTYSEKYESSNDFSVFFIFKEALTKVLSIVNCTYDYDRLDFIKGVAENMDSHFNLVLIMNLIPERFCRTDGRGEYFLKLLDTIKNTDDTIIQIHYKFFLRSLRTHK